ncbi:MAG TPA: CHAP domain-containing protein [Candidatus Saccharimonadales bacterium]|nr:CHAP domain-containing protein [Candidatus Saccharimonadales bacterium]
MVNTVNASNSITAIDPVDQLSSADIAVNVAKLTNLPESTAVANHASTVNIQLSVTSASETVVAKPQVVSADIKSRQDIIAYKTKSGDTVGSLAAKFDVTSDTIRWSNGLTGDSIAAETTIHVLPAVNGIVRKAIRGDTAQSLATRYQSSKDEIIAYNDAEFGLPIGQYIIIPAGLPASQQISSTSGGSTFGLAFGSSAIYGYNGYDYGWCTWYVASKVSVPTNWGNANTWDDGARATGGWKVSLSPKAGFIGQNNGPGLGHVAYVEVVSSDGKMIKYSDMNGLAGWGRVGHSDWVPVSKFSYYIYR